MASLLGFRISILVLCIIAIYFGSKDPVRELNESREVMRRQTSPTIARSCIQQGTIALTFDGGINTNFTPSILDVLKNNSVKATFHISTEHLGILLVDSIVRRIKEEGHTIGISWWGPNISTVDDTTLYANLRKMSDSIFQVLNVRPLFIRLPYYSTPQPDLEAKVANDGFIQTWWNLDPMDYKSCPPTPNGSWVPDPSVTAASLKVYQDNLNSFKAAGNLVGSFISTHMDLCPVANELQQIITYVKTNFAQYNFVTIDQCRGVSNAYMGAAPPLTGGQSQTGTMPSSTPAPTAATSSSTASTVSNTSPSGGSSDLKSSDGSAKSGSSAFDIGFESFTLRSLASWVAIAILGTFFMF